VHSGEDRERDRLGDERERDDQTGQDLGAQSAGGREGVLERREDADGCEIVIRAGRGRGRGPGCVGGSCHGGFPNRGGNMTHSPVTGGLKPTVTSGLGSVEFGTDTVTYFTRSVMREESARMVGEVADFTGLSIRTLRHYDDIGLVVPSGHTAGGFRLYTD